MAQRRIARGVRGEKRGSAGEAVSRLHREPQKAGDNIALKGTNTIAGMECPGKWTEEEPPHRRGNRRKTARSRRAADTIRGKKTYLNSKIEIAKRRKMEKKRIFFRKYLQE